jgi:hypothetical protein
VLASDAIVLVSSVALESLESKGGGSSVIVAVAILCARRRGAGGSTGGEYRGKGEGGHCDMGDELKPSDMVSTDSIYE